MHVAPGLAAFHNLAETVEIELPLEAAELVVYSRSSGKRASAREREREGEGEREHHDIRR